jgi:hypothetical protein
MVAIPDIVGRETARGDWELLSVSNLLWRAAGRAAAPQAAVALARQWAKARLAIGRLVAERTLKLESLFFGAKRIAELVRILDCG